MNKDGTKRAIARPEGIFRSYCFNWCLLVVGHKRSARSTDEAIGSAHFSVAD